MIVYDILLLIGILYLVGQVRGLSQRLASAERQLQAARSGSDPLDDRELIQRELALRAGRLEAGEPSRRSPEPPAPPVRETLAGLFERFVGGRLLIWIGGIALAAAGIFLIRHSIELVTPEARMIAAALLGLALLGAGEYARGGRLFSDDPRIGQALVGAGLAILYATVYGSYLLFGLLGSGAASGLMLLVTAAALGLSLRHGAPTAALGLIGGFLTPWLVGDTDAGATPVLAYLLLLDAALFAIAWRRGWTWLAAAAVLGSFAWTGYFMFGRPHDALLSGLFAALLGIGASLPRGMEGRPLGLFQPAIIALVELAILVGRVDLGVPAWALFGGMAAASLPLAALRPEQRLAPVAGLLLALLLIAAKAAVGEDERLLPIAAASATLLFAGGSLPLVRKAPLHPFSACGALAGPLLIMHEFRSELMEPPLWGVLALGLAAAALGLLRLVRTAPPSPDAEAGAFAAAATATLLLVVGAYDLAPRDLVSGAWLIVAIALLLAGVKLREKALRLSGLILLTITTLKVFLIDAAALEGVLRILSFVGLGVALIGIGKLYTKVLSAENGAGRLGSERGPADQT